MSQQVPPSRVLSHLGVMAAIAAVLGVVVAGIAIPFAGVIGIGAREVAKTVDELPAAFDTGTLPQTTRILDADGQLITTLYDQNRVYRPLDQISRNMTQAIVSIEDYRFYQHGAIDLKGTLRAFVTNQANSGTVQGGSSITQQLVKQTLLTQAQESGDKEAMKAATDDTYARKLKELRYAIALEQAHSKDWILERYLNTAYFGDGAYGVQAAARHYFDVNANQLNLKQSALLAGLVKNPSGYDPTNYPDAAITRRNVVLDREAQLHVITSDQADELKQEKLGLKVQHAQNGCVNATAPFFCDYVVHTLEQDPDLGATLDERKKLLTSGGLTVRTSLKLPNQKAADQSVSAHVHPTDQAIGAVAEIEPGTGKVLALAQSRPMGAAAKKGETYINYTIPAEVGNAPGFQAGSTFKAFVLATAITQGIPLTTTFNAAEHMTFNQADFANCPGASPFVGTWPVGNSTVSGTMDVYRGTRMSVNTFYAQLEQKTGVCDPFNLAKAMGVHLTDPSIERYPTFTLGVDNVSPLEMAGAYATFGARGKFCEPHPVTAILDSAGHTIKKYEPQCTQVMPETTADAVNDVLRGVQEPGGFGYDIGHTNLTTESGATIPSAGKTGTTQSGRSVWFMGYTPQIATAAMIAGANTLGYPISLVGQTIAGSYVSSVSGSGFAGPMWADAMHPIENSLDPENFTAPDPTVVHGVQIPVPDVGGMSVAKAKSTLAAAGFSGSVGSHVYSGYRSGEVAYSYPSHEAASGSTITLFISMGPEPKKKPSKPKGHGGGGFTNPGGHTPPGHAR
ncbi:transglycosylase domain-containing protein [Nocardioides nematodiphilus]|uniref:transglycosylase domain-containing protein n=1 Tax=Nocardioides nematodiphilus TaxID=2849669 RepID=UPI001CDA1D88|nr:transglycosylase domain-containing protein [Nocardioides nematodiphilus]MCA1981721.1 transglycosylase domain-containing protein [Nocardioides nematodiphilus]